MMGVKPICACSASRASEEHFDYRGSCAHGRKAFQALTQWIDTTSSLATWSKTATFHLPCKTIMLAWIFLTCCCSEYTHLRFFRQSQAIVRMTLTTMEVVDSITHLKWIYYGTARPCFPLISQPPCVVGSLRAFLYM